MTPPPMSADGGGPIHALRFPHLPLDGHGPTRRKDFAVAVIGDFLYVTGGWDGVEALDSVERYDSQSNTWIPLPPMLTPKYQHAAVVFDDKLYVIGGSDGRLELEAVEVFDPGEGTWEPCPPMRVPRMGLAAVSCCGALYALGGTVRVAGAVQYLTSVERYDIDRAVWEPMPSMRSARTNHAAVSMASTIYAFGGYDGIHALRTAECIDLDLNTNFQPLPRMGEARQSLAAATIRGCAVVIGGDDGRSPLDTSECLDPRTQLWTPLPRMGVRRSGHCAVEFEGALLALGGHTASAFRDSAQRLDPTKGVWCTLPPMRTKPHGLREGELPVKGGGPGGVMLPRHHLPPPRTWLILR